jgi:hypothetical protein
MAAANRMVSVCLGCPLMALSRHSVCAKSMCRVYVPTNVRFWGLKRTWRGLASMSANDPKRTFHAAGVCHGAAASVQCQL